MRRTLKISLDVLPTSNLPLDDVVSRIHDFVHGQKTRRYDEETWLQHTVLLGVRDEHTKQYLLELKADASLTEH